MLSHAISGGEHVWSQGGRDLITTSLIDYISRRRLCQDFISLGRQNRPDDYQSAATFVTLEDKMYARMQYVARGTRPRRSDSRRPRGRTTPHNGDILLIPRSSIRRAKFHLGGLRSEETPLFALIPRYEVLILQLLRSSSDHPPQRLSSYRLLPGCHA